MQMYILHKSAFESAKLIPAKLRGNNYAQKMLIELCQCLSNLMGSKYIDEKFYKYKAVPPEFVSFIFKNTEWTYNYAQSLLYCCLEYYKDFNKTDTFKNCNYIINKFNNYFETAEYLHHPTHGFFIPAKEYGKREYLPIDECIKKYQEYLNWKIEK